MLIRPRSRLIFIGVTALAIGFALGLRAMPSGTSQTNQQPDTDSVDTFKPWARLGPQAPSRQGFQLASLESEPALLSRGGDSRSELTGSISRRASSSEDPATGTRVASFDERFAGAMDWTGRQAAETEQRADIVVLQPDGHAVARSVVSRAAHALTPLPPAPPPGPSKKQIRVADAAEDLTAPPSDASSDLDDHTAIYDISAHTVYLPNGRRLEAHSGLGSHLDDPRAVSEKDRGPTPPNIYDLSLREDLFHGVRALRLTPVGNGKMFGRDGMLAHSYMLGANGQSNGCVSFSDYPAFLRAYTSGEVNRLVVVEHLANAPSPRTASGWIPEPIRALFGRS